MQAHKLSPAVKAHRTMVFNQLYKSLDDLLWKLALNDTDPKDLEYVHGETVARSIISSRKVLQKAKRYL